METTAVVSHCGMSPSSVIGTVAVHWPCLTTIFADLGRQRSNEAIWFGFAFRRGLWTVCCRLLEFYLLDNHLHAADDGLLLTRWLVKER